MTIAPAVVIVIVNATIVDSFPLSLQRSGEANPFAKSHLNPPRNSFANLQSKGIQSRGDQLRESTKLRLQSIWSKQHLVSKNNKMGPTQASSERFEVVTQDLLFSTSAKRLTGEDNECNE